MSYQKKQEAQRQALIVLGMHRSGTSAISGVLALLGAQAPKSLMPATLDNPKGYWESTAIMHFHDRILGSAGTRWNDWDGFNADWADSAAGMDFNSDVSALLEAEYGAAPLILIKDPRMCRLFPLWSGALRELDIVPKVVIPVRHPQETVRSLEVRDNLTRSQARLIWLRHILDAEYSSRKQSRVFVGYSAMLRDWPPQIARISALLEVKWPRWSNETISEINEHLAPALRHQVADEDGLASTDPIAVWVAQAYRAIESLTRDGDEAAAFAVLDAVRDQLDSSSVIYGPVVHEQRRQLERRLDGAENEKISTMAAAEALAGKFDLLQQENLANYNLYAEAKKALSECQAENEARMRENEANARAQSEYSELQASMTTQLEGRETECAALHEEFAAATLRFNQEIAVLQQNLRQAEDSVHERFSETAELSERVLTLEAKVATADHAAIKHRKVDETLRRMVDDRDARVGALEHELDAQNKLVAEYRAELEKIRSGRYWRLTTAVRGIAKGRRPRSAVIEPPDSDVLRESGLFDPDWYLGHYPDVRAKGMDPIKHYLRYGAKEGRDPCAAFSTKGYNARYPDVASAGFNPLVHYLKYGRREGRSILVMNIKEDNGHA